MGFSTTTSPVRLLQAGMKVVGAEQGWAPWAASAHKLPARAAHKAMPREKLGGLRHKEEDTGRRRPMTRQLAFFGSIFGG